MPTTLHPPPAVGIIGLGRMGSAIAERLLHRGYRLLGWDIAPAKLALFTSLGGRAAASSQEIARTCDRLILCLPDRTIVAEVLSQLPLRPGQIVVHVTSGEPGNAEAPSDWPPPDPRPGEPGVAYLEARFSSGIEELRAGAARFMVGGETSAFAACADMFAALSAETTHVVS